jgi:hypothetical protein
MSLRMSTPWCVAAMLIFAVSACGSGGGSSVSPQATTAPATAVPVDGSFPQPATARTSVATNPTMRALPTSVLKPLHEFTYKKIAGVEVIPEVAAKPDIFEGSISRTIYFDDVDAGGITVIRFRKGYISDEAMGKRLFRQIVEEFTQTENLDEERYSGHTVLAADNIRGTGRNASAWLDDRDVTIILMAKTLPARAMAKLYLSSSDGTKSS